MSATLLKARYLRLDPYRDSDLRELYAVRFHPTVRTFMTDPTLVSYASHRDWSRANLGGERALCLWLVRPPTGGRAIGFTQLRVSATGDSAEIGVMFREPAQHPLQAAVATAMTLATAYRQLGCTWVRSYVALDHARALSFNRAWGGEPVPSDRQGQYCLAMHRDVCLANPRFQRVLARWVIDETASSAGAPVQR